MKKYVLPLAAAIMIAFAGSAHAGKIYFTAYKDGKQAAVTDPKTKKTMAGKEIEVQPQTMYDKLSAARKKQYSEAADMCGEKYYLTKKGADWKKAHESAKHDIQVRDHVKRGTYKVMCPKEAAAPPADKKKP